MDKYSYSTAAEKVVGGLLIIVPAALGLGYLVAFVFWPGNTLFWTVVAAILGWVLRHPVGVVLGVLVGLLVS